MIIAAQSLAAGLLGASGLVSALDGLVLAYVGPDQLMPLTSVLGAVAGLVLMFWNRVLGVARRVRNLFGARKLTTGPAAATED